MEREVSAIRAALLHVRIAPFASYMRAVSRALDRRRGCKQSSEVHTCTQAYVSRAKQHFTSAWSLHSGTCIATFWLKLVTNTTGSLSFSSLGALSGEAVERWAEMRASERLCTLHWEREGKKGAREGGSKFKAMISMISCLCCMMQNIQTCADR